MFLTYYNMFFVRNFMCGCSFLFLFVFYLSCSSSNTTLELTFTDLIDDNFNPSYKPLWHDDSPHLTLNS